MCLNHRRATRSHREAYFEIALAYIFKYVCKQPMGEHAQVVISRGHQKNCAGRRRMSVNAWGFNLTLYSQYLRQENNKLF